jgi:hemoglobin
MRFITPVVLSIALAATATVVHADDKAPPKMEKAKTLYDRLGGKPAITAVIKEFLGNVAGDKRINGRFAKTNIPKLQQSLIDQVTVATGGPGKYKGKSMPEAHKGMKITDDEFTALVEDLVKALDKYKVPDAEKGELLGALGKLKPEIVGK